MTMSSANRCFICMKCPPILELVHQGQVNDVKLKSIWNKIFQYLLIPKEKFSETFDMCKGEWFCTDCVEIVHRVGNLQDKSVEFELKIQKNAEKLGEAIAAAGPTTGGMAGTSARSKKYQDAWEKFRLPILQNFASGRLPSPCVRLTTDPALSKKAENLKRQRECESDSSCQANSTGNTGKYRKKLCGPASRRLRPTKSARTFAPVADIEQQQGKQKQVQKKSSQSVRLRAAQNRSRKRRKAQSAARRAYQSRRVGKLGKAKPVRPTCLNRVKEEDNDNRESPSSQECKKLGHRLHPTGPNPTSSKAPSNLKFILSKASKQTFRCPRCAYSRIVILPPNLGGNTKGIRASKMKFARNKIVSHYLETHLAITHKDLKPHGTKRGVFSYRCPSCPFSTNPIARNGLFQYPWMEKKERAMGVLFRHCKANHE